MVSDLLVDVGLGVYLGILAGIFPAVVAFALGFIFKYLTGVSIPGLGVVVLAGALAGISGGLLGLLNEEVSQSGAGMAAFLVVLMLSLWAHAQGDKLGATVPRHLSFSQLHRTGFSADFLERVDTYGQLRIRPITVEDIEGFPALPEETREEIRETTWKFPAALTVPELEAKLAEKLMTEHGLSEVAVSINADGLAEISAAPETASLSRRVPSGKRAVSIRTLLPTGLAVGDRVTLSLPGGNPTGEVVSARTDGKKDAEQTPPPAEPAPTTDGGTPTPAERQTRAPTADGGKGTVTIALPGEEARQVVREEFAKLTVHSRGKGREYETLEILQGDDNQLQLVTVGAGGRLDGVEIGEAASRQEFGVAILALRRRTERFIAPPESTTLAAGDELVVAGKPGAIRSFREAVS